MARCNSADNEAKFLGGRPHIVAAARGGNGSLSRLMSAWLLLVSLATCAEPRDAACPFGETAATWRGESAVTELALGTRPAAPSALAGADPSAEVLLLDGLWTAWLDPDGAGFERDWAAALTRGEVPAGSTDPLDLVVPGPLEQLRATVLYDGAVWYVRDLELPDRHVDARLALSFEQSNYLTSVWLDGEVLGRHEGGYDAFELALPRERFVAGRLRLVVAVVDPGEREILGLRLATTPHAKESWYENFGGLLGSVSLRATRGRQAVIETLFTRVLREPAGSGDGTAPTAAQTAAPPTDALQPRASLAARIVLEAALPASEPDSFAWTARLRALDEHGAPTDEVAHAWQGQASGAQIELTLPADTRLDAADGLRSWTPRSPQRYRLEFEVDGRLLAARSTGFRDVELRADGVFVAGRHRPLSAVLWQPHFVGTGGQLPAAGTLIEEAERIADTGFDLVRAHVRPAPTAFLEACDRLGLLVLAEPAIGWVRDDPGLPARLLAEVEWMVARDHHHPSILAWGLLNELSGRAYRHAPALLAACAQADPTRAVLEDSGGFLGGGRHVPERASADGVRSVEPMTDRHIYPAWPLPPAARAELDAAGRDEPSPVFVSEFGYGTLVEAVETSERFREAGLLTEEAGKFRSMARTQTAALAALQAGGFAAPEEGWVAAAQQRQAEAVQDMLGAVRANDTVDLYCWTQWSGVSGESSAGLVSPWGQPRPAQAAMREALREVLPVVLPGSASAFHDEDAALEVVVVNDSGAELRAGLRLHILRHGRAREREELLDLGEVALSPGVTRRALTLPPPADGLPREPGELHLELELIRDDGRASRSAPATIVLVSRPASPADGRTAGLTVLPPDAGLSARLALAGLREVPLDCADVILLRAPRTLAADLPLVQRLALWEAVRRGAPAFALLDDPGADTAGQISGLSRGVATLSELPVALTVASAAGNFQGRYHVLRRGNAFHTEAESAAPAEPARLLGRQDAALSPRAMVAGDWLALAAAAATRDEADGAEPGTADVPGAPSRGPRVELLTVGPLGNALGAPLLTLPFGAGEILACGLPLLDVEAAGVVEPQREVVLAAWLLRAAFEAQQRSGAATAHAAPGDAPRRPSAEELAHLSLLFAAVDERAAFGDRASPFVAQAGELPRPAAALDALLSARRSAQLALLDGQPERAAELLEAALSAPEQLLASRLLAPEAAVFNGLSELAARATEHSDVAAFDQAYDVAELWAAGLLAWLAADGDAAELRLTEALALLSRDAAER